MSKKTRKKSVAAAPAKASRAGLKKPAQKTLRTTRPASPRKPTKSPTKTAGKKSGKAPAKSAPKASPEASSKASAKAAPVRAKKSPPETVASSTGNAATPAKKTVAVARAAAPAEQPSPGTAATEGGPAPQFDLPRDGGERVSLADYLGRKLVIFFYPRADTPGCTREAIDFTRLNDDFAAIDTAVLGVSADSIKAQESFRNKHQLSIPLISDETHEMLQAYGAWGEKSMYGRSFQGVIRTTVLVDSHGRIAKIWHGVKVDGHADAVLAAARQL
jgi:thioredoxin-dependent peroxiredoxin